MDSHLRALFAWLLYLQSIDPLTPIPGPPGSLILATVPLLSAAFPPPGTEFHVLDEYRAIAQEILATADLIEQGITRAEAAYHRLRLWHQTHGDLPPVPQEPGTTPQASAEPAP